MINTTLKLQNTTRLPNLLVIGAMKAGTSSLCMELSRHPDVFFPEAKEPNSLVRHLLGEKNALRDYARLYRGRTEAILGDGSTGNSKVPFRPDASKLAAKILPNDTRIIYITRDPITRIERHIAHNIGDGLSGQVQDFLFSTPEYIALSAYNMQLSYWRRYFPDTAILKISLEDYQSDRDGTLNRVFSHIGLDPTPVINMNPANANRSTNRRSAQKSFFGKLLFSRSYLFLREYLPKPLRRQLAHILLPRATTSDVKLSEDDKKCVLEKIEKLDQLIAPNSEEIEAIILSMKKSAP